MLYNTNGTLHLTALITIEEECFGDVDEQRAETKKAAKNLANTTQTYSQLGQHIPINAQAFPIHRECGTQDTQCRHSEIC